jgi:hypothetical protein
MTPLTTLVIIGIYVHVCVSFRSSSITSRLCSFFYFRAGINDSQRNKLMSHSRLHTVDPNDIAQAIAKAAEISAAISPAVEFADWAKDNFVAAMENFISVPSPTSSFVKRPLLENLVNRILKATPDGTYTVVYGAKGVGKSMLLDNMVSGQRGVVKLIVTSVKNKDEIVALLLLELLGENASQGWFTASKMVDAVRKCKVVPTFIFDVERGGSPDQVQGIQAVRSLCKLFAPFSQYIVILSEANAVLEFGKDVSREEFVFVDELTTEEATEMLKNMNVQLSTSQQQDLFQTIGTNPAMLIKLHKKLNAGLPLEDFVKDYLLFATEDLVAFPHEPRKLYFPDLSLDKEVLN